MPYGFGTDSGWGTAAAPACVPVGIPARAPAAPLTVVGTVSVPDTGRFREESPTRIWYAPAAVVQPLLPVFQYARSCVLTVNVSVCAWPGLRVTRWKPRSWCTGSPVDAGSPT